MSLSGYDRTTLSFFLDFTVILSLRLNTILFCAIRSLFYSSHLLSLLIPIATIKGVPNNSYSNTTLIQG